MAKFDYVRVNDQMNKYSNFGRYENIKGEKISPKH